MLQNQLEKEEMNGNTILKSVKVREIIQNKRRLVEVPHTASVADTLNALLANIILAVLVAAPPGQWIGAGGSMILESDKLTGSVRKQYIGMVNILDILLHVAECVAGTDIEANLMSVPIYAIIGRSSEGLSLWSVNPDTSGIESDSWGRHSGEHISTPDFTCKARETETCHDKRQNASSTGKVRGKQADYGKTTSAQYENAGPFLYSGPGSALLPDELPPLLDLLQSF